MKMKKVNLSFPQELIDMFLQHEERGNYRSMSEAVRSIAKQHIVYCETFQEIEQMKERCIFLLGETKDEGYQSMLDMLTCILELSKGLGKLRWGGKFGRLVNNEVFFKTGE